MQTGSTHGSSRGPLVDPAPSSCVAFNGRAMEAAGPAENRQTDAGFPPVLGRRQTDAGAHSYHSPQRRVPLTDNKPLAETGKSSCRGPARIVDAAQSSPRGTPNLAARELAEHGERLADAPGGADD